MCLLSGIHEGRPCGADLVEHLWVDGSCVNGRPAQSSFTAMCATMTIFIQRQDVGTGTAIANVGPASDCVFLS